MFRRQFNTISSSPALRGAFFFTFTFLLAAILFCRPATAANGSFPTPAEVFQGRTFSSESERDIFYLHAIHDHYAAQWPILLEGNINEGVYIREPAKLLRFIDELGMAMRDQDDAASITNLTRVTSHPRFFTNINDYHPEILEATAQALMALGPHGRKALADSFSINHYRGDPEGLELLAKTIGEARLPDPAFVEALAATAFAFSTTNGGVYPHCTEVMVQNLLLLPAGLGEVRSHFTTNNIFADPVRFQSVIQGIADAGATNFKANLKSLDGDLTTQLLALRNNPGDYRDALEDLRNRTEDA